RRLLDHSILSSPGVKGVKEALSDQELRAIQIAGQANALVPALISIDLRAAECSTFTALSSDAKIDVCSGENHLIRASRGVTGHENAHRRDTCPAGKVLFGNPCTSLCGKTRVEQIGQNLSLPPAEAQENRTSSTPDAAVVVLPKRMIVSNAC